MQGCQEAKDLPCVPNVELTGLIYTLVHGLIDIQAGGRMRKEKGLTATETSLTGAITARIVVDWLG